MGGVQDPRQKGKHPELKDKVITPDVLLQPHDASLEMLFYEGSSFRSNIAETSSPPSMVPGTVPCARDTK